MSIIHRPHRGTLKEAINEAREFSSLGECLQTLINEFNNSQILFHIKIEDIIIIPYGKDMRVGWKDNFMICCVPYNRVSDKKGYIAYYGDKYDNPLQLFGTFSTDYIKF